MQLFVDNMFFIWLAVLSVPAFFLGIFERPIKYYGMAATVFFIWMSMGFDLTALGWMLGFTAYEYLLIRVYLAIRSGRYNRTDEGEPVPDTGKGIYLVFVLLSIAPLVIYKVLAIGENPGRILAFAGISYMTFKAVQIIIETYDGIITEVRPFDYLYLMLFFPTITSGPIDRSRRFNEDLGRRIPREEYLEMAGTGLARILLGMVYKFGLAAFMYVVMNRFGAGPKLQEILINMYSYGLYLFFDFAGYSLMAVGAGYIFGIRVPDNFNMPFIARDINDFWNRWHITLSHWLRDYVFSRITMDLVRSRKIRNKLTIATIAFMTNMLIMGLWHGLTIDYVAYGLYHGVLLSLFEVIRKKSRFYKKHKNDKWFIVIMWFITLHLVLIGFMIFSGKAALILRHRFAIPMP